MAPQSVKGMAAHYVSDVWRQNKKIQTCTKYTEFHKKICMATRTMVEVCEGENDTSEFFFFFNVSGVFHGVRIICPCIMQV